MKFNIISLTQVILIALSIWLSFSVKKANKKLQDAETHAIMLEQNLVLSKYQTTILQEALQINISKAPANISPGMPMLNTDTLPHTILYLKANACSPCNMPVIEMIIDAAAQRPNFCIASHTSNQHFLKPVIEKANLTTNERVIWLTNKLYDYGKSSYDSELLFVDANSSVMGVLPLELLKEKALFESWLAPYYSSDDSKSSDE